MMPRCVLSSMVGCKLRASHDVWSEGCLDASLPPARPFRTVPRSRASYEVEATTPFCAGVSALNVGSATLCREAIIARKRSEYRDMVPKYYESAAQERSADEVGALRQVAVDVPRTAPGVPFFHMPQIQKSLERILYLWGIRSHSTFHL
jgi:Rab-GTPase-TBC domain